ncbi:NAD(P)-binding domain-containing protein [Pseudarthrobacter sp. J75]|uniref:NAD(P)-binding domain-containing protein n=1 Tax=unclassified Pseudarthrobacter TaxID=2647000 RepID=UPI002E80E49C|nr:MULTISPECIES: NAD(P)-binding domain-containing protein [unclassified Pseudarthrobacter]MEE2523451.1 NAD(P)-binding domain-containing protein [Pseudarthrobacter sp. J47]MEE2529416.1 NAD(P)-binding domain-containing protein [Pseudarthrobacter sp. J75]
MNSESQAADVVVIGAGQAGLSAAYHLQRRGLVPAGPAQDPDALTYVVFDAEDGPGGAWRHRWKSLLMATVNGISDLPGIAKPEVDPCEPSSEFLTRYFGGYEEQLNLAVRRPVKVSKVSRADDDPAGRLIIETSAGIWSAAAVINATGTWTRPFWPIYPGQSSFKGRQLHVADYVAAEEFRGQHVIVVGGGISAVGLLEEISKVTTTSWFTRRPPVWRDSEFDSKAGHDAVALVEERVRQGLPPQSVVSVTGLIWTPVLRAAAARGALDRQPMFTAIEPDGVRLADGGLLKADVILWATGFRAELEHLAPLHLRGPGGGIAMDGTQVAAEPRVHLVGYGPSSSTIGANRAGRAAVSAILRLPSLAEALKGATT